MTQNSIEVVPYSALWKELFEKEQEHLRQILRDDFITCYHVGSTSVEGLQAKPVIDCILIVTNRKKALRTLVTSGYKHMGCLNIPFREFLSKKDPYEVHLHLYDDINHPEITLNLSFKEFLQTHPLEKEAYGALKLSLSKEKDAAIIKNGIRTYTLKKDPFIKSVLKKCGFKELCLRFCTHFQEWEQARILRQTIIFDPLELEDPYTWTFEDKNHLHFIFYQGIDIIGYCHIQLTPHHKSILRIIVLLPPYQRKGIGSHFLTLIEKYLKENGITALYLDSSQEALSFYLKNGYKKDFFEDGDNQNHYDEDIPLSKNLI